MSNLMEVFGLHSNLKKCVFVVKKLMTGQQENWGSETLKIETLYRILSQESKMVTFLGCLPVVLQ